MAKAIAAIVTTIGTFAAEHPYIFAAAKLGANLAVAAVASSLAAPDVPKADAIKLPIKQARPPRYTGTGRALISGAYMLYESSGQAQNSYDVLALHDGEIDAFEEWWVHDDVVTLDGSGWVQELTAPIYRNHRIKLEYRYGVATETAYSEPAAALPTMWSANHRGDGIASVYVLAVAPTAENFASRFPYGEPVVRTKARLSKVYDPRDAAQDPNNPATWAWSENPVCNFLFYLCFAEGGPRLSYDRFVLPRIADWKRAADVCDEAVPLKAGGTEPRYRQGGGWKWDTAPSAVIARYLETFDGWMSRDEMGCLVVRAGKYYGPSVTITDEDCIGGYTLNRNRRDERAVNEIVVSYTSPDHKWNSVAAEPWRNEADITATGLVRSEPLDLLWVQHFGQARRLAKRAVLRSGAPAWGTITVDLFKDGILGERYLRVQLGNEHPPIMRDLVVEVGNARIDLVDCTVTFDWVKADENIDAWDAATEEGTAPEGTIDSGATGLDMLGDPDAGDFTITGTSLDSNGGSAPVVQVAGVPTDPDARVALVRFRRPGDPDWTYMPAVDIQP